MVHEDDIIDGEGMKWGKVLLESRLGGLGLQQRGCSGAGAKTLHGTL
jgi:hypothetical protein